ncbi:CdaR family transcriptional regulator [Tsukamurella sp. 1534]|uniref:PucR family transcriptional regulator n=1 Tax=Tsukamurella sp. 1534 TaxID=1151061 RepID=UPI0002D3563E|nr:helix-turn-helix domain-containing protein [Tsukamurella sp. 1534]
MQQTWPEPSERVKELIRRGAEIASNPPEEWVAEIHAATLTGAITSVIAADPTLAELVRKSNTAALLLWATHNLRAPGTRVPPNTDAEALAVSRDLVRRGLDLHGIDSYRTGVNVAWRLWMEVCFGLTDDPDELRELLSVTWESMSTYISDTINALAIRMAGERNQLTTGTNADRLETVSLLLEGAPLSRDTAEQRLGYRLTGPHTAAVVWTTGDAGDLDAAARALARHADSPRPLTVVASASALWIWLPGTVAPPAAELARDLSDHPDVRVALGRPGQDLDGFRRSHLDAGTAQRLLTRLGSPRRVARYDDIALISLVTGDTTKADEFVRDTLGDLLSADQDTRDTVATYVAEQFNTSRTAERLYTHRNTVIRRLTRADELLPRPLAENPTGVAVALDVLRWLGDA